MNNELKQLLQMQREQESYHLSMEKEFGFYRKIAAGDLETAKKFTLLQHSGMGVLSLNELRNEKYHTIILLAMITRFCIEEGLGNEEAYTLSDLYIRRIDECTAMDQIKRLQKESVMEFAKTMHELQTHSIKILQVKRSVDYIERNLTKPLSAIDISEEVHCNPDYLSRLFKKEFGMTLGEYVLKRKCNAASYMLEHSEETVTEIAQFLGFASTSHFIERFKKVMHISPEKYRIQAKGLI